MDCINCKAFSDRPGQSVCLKQKNFLIHDAYKSSNCNLKEEVESCCTCAYVLKKDFVENTQYCCTLQNGKVIKDMSNVRMDFSNFPPCPLGLYEHV